MLLETKHEAGVFSIKELATVTDHIMSSASIETISKPEDHPKHPGQLYAKTYRWDYYAKENNNIFEIVNEKIEKITGIKQKVIQSYILESYYPFEVHTDLGPVHHEDPAYTFIIPLDDYDTNTIVFNEYHETSSELQDFKDSYTGELTLRIPKDIAIRLSHLYPTDLRYLTVKNVCKWAKGSLIAFDRRYYHCSDNYLKTGVENKKALLIQTKRYN
jgi:hypothetical protein